jgi:alditol oxidase
MTITNWAGNVTFTAAELRRPASVDELAELVAGARQVRVLGSGHSFNRLADSADALVSLAGLPRVFEVAADRASVRVNASATLAELAAALQAEGLALHTMPSLPHITVAGACLTGTHGSGDGAVSLAGVVREVELVTADGTVRTLAHGDDGFGGAVVSLGALGVVTALRLAVLPGYDVRQRVFDGLAWPSLVEHVDALLAAAYSVSVFTALDGPSRVWLKARDGEPEPAELLRAAGVHPADGPQHPVRGQDAANTTDQLGPAGPWHERLPHFRPDRPPSSSGAELQAEYLLPRAHAAEALAVLHGLRERISPVAQTIELRSVAAEDQWLSMAHQRACLGIHFTLRPEPEPVRAMLVDLERELAPLAARPHWGKLFVAGPAELAERYERLADFRRLRQRMDPDGRFSNELVDSWFPA